MRVLDWTVAALQDLEAIDSWLGTNVDPEIAVGMLIAIRERADFLLDFPGGGPMIAQGHHSLRVRGTPYSLVYRLAGERIEILRIFHAKQDWRP